MAFPPGLQTIPATVGPVYDSDGDLVAGLVVKLTPEWELIHDPTSSRVLRDGATMTTGVDGTASTTIVASDADGLQRTNFRYLVEFTHPTKRTRESFWLFAGKAALVADLEKLQTASGSSGTSVPVATGPQGPPGDVTPYAASTGTGVWAPAVDVPAAQRRTLTGATTVQLADPSNTARAVTLTLVLQQDGAGGRTITWPTAVRWPYGQAPVLSTAAGAVDVVTLLWAGSWLGFLSGVAMASP